VDAAYLARFGRDAEPPGHADECERGLGAGTRHLEGRRPAWLGQGAVGQEGTAPGRDGVTGATGDHGRRQAAHRTTAVVEEPGLAGERLAVLGDPNEVAAA